MRLGPHEIGDDYPVSEIMTILALKTNLAWRSVIASRANKLSGNVSDVRDRFQFLTPEPLQIQAPLH